MIAIKKEDLVHVASTFTYYTSTMSKLSNETRIIITAFPANVPVSAQELCESRGGCPAGPPPSLIVLMVSVNVKQH